jgi:hypothetical protein
VVLAGCVVVAACVWVSAVRFKDEASATDCGTPLGAAWHGRLAPTALNDLPPGVKVDPRFAGGLFGLPGGTPLLSRVCQGEARIRVAIAGVVIVVAVGGLLLSRRHERLSGRKT